MDDSGKVLSSTRALLAGLIDYAGLFPPARLPMPAAVYNYAHYLDLPFHWILGRFIVSASRLQEFEREATPSLPPPGSPAAWHLSLLSTDPARDIVSLNDFNRRHPGAPFDSIEVQAGSAAQIVSAAESVPRPILLYCEIPLGAETTSLVSAIAKSGAKAKVRCGGLSADVFPPAGQLVSFFQCCCAARVGFKATAGLHHPVRGVYPFTYEPDSRKGLMHGFLNVFLAAAFVWAGMGAGDAIELLDERSSNAFRFLNDGIIWRGHHLSIGEIVEMRRDFALAFGSCSFSDPVSDLRKMDLI